jgi:hypothetical protein
MLPDDPRARQLAGVLGATGPLTAALETAGVRFVIIDAAGPVAGRLPGCKVVIDRLGVVVYEVPR